MVQHPPERVTVEGKLAHRMLFDLIAAGHKFEFDEMLRLWFAGQETRLVGFLQWLDLHGLEIRKQQ